MTGLSIAEAADMVALRRLAGWLTIPHPDDTVVVRLALRTARDRTDADQGRGTPAERAALEAIEARWLDRVLGDLRAS